MTARNDASIRATLEQYARGLDLICQDDRGIEPLQHCFTADVTASYGGNQLTVSGRDALIELLGNARRHAFTYHQVGQVHVTYTTRRSALVWSTALAYVCPQGEGQHLLMRQIIYEDQLTKTGRGRWQISSRTHRAAWMVELGVPVLAPPSLLK